MIAFLRSHRKLKMFVTGVLVRLIGVGLIILGEGHDNLWAKALVVCGVIITVTGMAILRYLLFQPLLDRAMGKLKIWQL